MENPSRSLSPNKKGIRQLRREIGVEKSMTYLNNLLKQSVHQQRGNDYG